MAIKKIKSSVDFISQEHEVLQFWKDQNIFNKRRKINKGKPKWSFIDGPITANNPMGVHHAWGRTLKDIYNRYKAMSGYELRYQNGFDCQGLWVEVEVEKELGFKSKKDVEDFGVEKFVNLCKERVLKYSKYKLNSLFDLDIGWIGIIHIIQCLMKTIIQYGVFLKNYLKKKKFIVMLM